MIDRLAIIVVNYKDYANRYLADFLTSLRAQDFTGSWQLFLVDNESTAQSLNYLASRAGEATIIVNRHNDGFAKGNNDGIKAAIKAGHEYFVLLNLDIILTPDALSQLVAAADKFQNWGSIQALLMLHPATDKINSWGNSFHYLGFGYCLGNGQLPCDVYSQQIAYGSGAGLLLSRESWQKVGGFDEKFWMYHDDLELGWKLRLAGYENYLANQAVIYHKYQFAKSIKQYYWMERNRGIVLLTHYRLLTLLLILPILLISEIGLFILASTKGFGWQKLRSYLWFVNPLNWSYLWRRRQFLKKLRVRPDRAMIKWLAGEINYQDMSSQILPLANLILKTYWQMVKKLIVW